MEEIKKALEEYNFKSISSIDFLKSYFHDIYILEIIDLFDEFKSIKEEKLLKFFVEAFYKFLPRPYYKNYIGINYGNHSLLFSDINRYTIIRQDDKKIILNKGKIITI